MKNFDNWMTQRDEKQKKIIAMRRWLWNREYEGKKDVPPPIDKNDTDYEWVKRKAEKTGYLHPFAHE